MRRNDLCSKQRTNKAIIKRYVMLFEMLFEKVLEEGLPGFERMAE